VAELIGAVLTLLTVAFEFFEGATSPEVRGRGF
jgi:hypothetical protein